MGFFLRFRSAFQSFSACLFLHFSLCSPFSSLHKTQPKEEEEEEEELLFSRVNSEITSPHKLGLGESTSFIVGVMIGSGIFSSPGIILSQVEGSIFFFLLVWLLSGLVVLLLAVCWAELGTLLPQSGGEAVYLGYLYGPSVSFSFVFASFFVLKSGSIAAIALVAAQYLLELLEIDSSLNVKISAMGLVVLLTVINSHGLKLASKLNVGMVIVKMIAVIYLILMGVLYLKIRGARFLLGDQEKRIPERNFFLLTKNFINGMFLGLWSFEGWATLCYMASSIKDVGKTLPRANFLGVLLVLGVYLLVNLSYVLILPTSVVASSSAVALKVAQGTIRYSFGPWVLALFVTVSSAGSCSGIIASAVNIFSQSTSSGENDGLNPPRGLAVKYVRREGDEVPLRALWTLALWCCVLLLFADFQKLVNVFALASWVYNSLCALGLILLRKREPHKRRPYKVPTLIFPVIILIVGIVLILNSIIVNPLQSAGVLAFLTAAGVIHKLVAEKKK